MNLSRVLQIVCVKFSEVTARSTEPVGMNLRQFFVIVEKIRRP